MRSHELANILLSAPDARLALRSSSGSFIRGIETVSHGFYGCDDIIVIQSEHHFFGVLTEARNLIEAVAIPGIQASPMGKRNGLRSISSMG